MMIEYKKLTALIRFYDDQFEVIKLFDENNKEFVSGYIEELLNNDSDFNKEVWKKYEGEG